MRRPGALDGGFDEHDPDDTRGRLCVRRRVRAGRMHATDRRHLRHAGGAARAAGRPRRAVDHDDAGREYALRHASVAGQHDAEGRERRRTGRRAAAGPERRAGRPAAAGHAAADAVLMARVAATRHGMPHRDAAGEMRWRTSTSTSRTGCAMRTRWSARPRR
ncbi:hypothetical protein F01_530049 [Burkholderia cenocepacia]|nr:hypothetical protein F01_530049 [Burkholderia cenocepacia]